MAQLFKRSSNVLARASLLGGLLGVVLYAATSYAVFQSGWVTGQDRAPAQPVPFSHAHHVGGVGLECRYCHTTATTDAFAGMPTTETCMHCHAHLWTQAEMLAPVRDSLATGQPIRWRRVHDLADFVYFDHSAHTQAGVDCITCHGDVSTMPLTRQDAPLTMTWCIDCHRHAPERYDRPARTSCSTCHR